VLEPADHLPPIARLQDLQHLTELAGDDVVLALANQGVGQVACLLGAEEDVFDVD